MSVAGVVEPHLPGVGGRDAKTAVVFESFDLPPTNQRILGSPHAPGTVTPLALRPSAHDGDRVSLDDVISSVEALQADGEGVLTRKLAQHGTLLFRDVPIRDAADFSRFAHAFGYRPHEIIGIVVDRPVVAPNVAPANEAPKEVLIYNHNESPQVPHAPEYIFFYGHRAPSGRGGETPISSSLELFERARGEMPEFVDDLAAKGILSTVRYSVDRQYAGGSTLRQAFGKDVADGDDEATRRAKMEAQIARYGRGPHTTWEWSGDGTELVLTHRLPAVRTQQGTGLPSLFTGLAAYYRRQQLDVEGGRRASVEQLYGDGSVIPERYLARLAAITDEIRVLHRWQRGDVLVYDNVISQHGREPWEGEQGDRVVYASLFDGASVPGAYGDADWAQVVQALDG